jgi:hypothetical protein
VPTPRIILSGITSPGNPSLVFSPYQPDRSYLVQTSAKLGSNAIWTTLTNIPVTVNPNGQGVINLAHQSNSTMYFRLTVGLPP